MSDIGIASLINKSPQEIEKYVNMFIKSSLNLRYGIIENTDYSECMIGIIRDTYMCNLLMRYIGLMMLLSNDTFWIDLDNKITSYIANYYNNSKFKQKQIELYNHYYQKYQKNKTDYDYCRFLDKMINKSDTIKLSEIKKYISMYENRILNLLRIDPVMRIPKKYFTTIPKQFEMDSDKDKMIIPLTEENYHYLLDIIDDIDIRHQIENQYNSRSETVMNDLSKLIILRHKYANELGYESYYKYINRGKHDNSETIKELITELNKSLDENTSSEVNSVYEFIKKINKNIPYLSQSDILKYVRYSKSEIQFNLDDVIDVLFRVIETYFDLKITKSNCKSWTDDMSVYELYDNTTNDLLGRLYVDIKYNQKRIKNVSEPISIILTDRMLIGDSNKQFTVAEVALLGNYNQQIDFDNIKKIFREMGYALTGLCYNSRVGLLNNDEEFSNFMPHLMEYILWDKDTITLLINSAKKYNKNIDHSFFDQIQNYRFIDISYNLKLRCVSSKFDHLIHNSPSLIKLYSTSEREHKSAKPEIIKTYMMIYKEAFGCVENYHITDIKYIDPSTIVQIANGSQGVLYSNLMNEIFSYGSYWIIKNKKDKDFRKIVLSNSIENYRDLVRKYISKLDDNSFHLYMKNVINHYPSDHKENKEHNKPVFNDSFDDDFFINNTINIDQNNIVVKNKSPKKIINIENDDKEEIIEIIRK